MNKIKYLLFVGLLVAGLSACKTQPSLNAAAYAAENLAADTAQKSVEGFDLYFADATNGVSDADIAGLTKTKTKVHDFAHKLGEDGLVLDDLRQAYKANSADTNKTALASAISALAEESTNVIDLVAPYISKAK